MKRNVLDTDLGGKVAVVTGAGGVLCSDFARVLARAGASVALLDINEEAARRVADEINSEGGHARRLPAMCSTAPRARRQPCALPQSWEVAISL